MLVATKRKKPTALEVIMQERISLGGEVMTRREAYDMLIADGCSHRCADWFAFHTPVEVQESDESRNIEYVA